jgi:hypothetical protein
MCAGNATSGDPGSAITSFDAVQPMPTTKPETLFVEQRHEPTIAYAGNSAWLMPARAMMWPADMGCSVSGLRGARPRPSCEQAHDRRGGVGWQKSEKHQRRDLTLGRLVRAASMNEDL